MDFPTFDITKPKRFTFHKTSLLDTNYMREKNFLRVNKWGAALFFVKKYFNLDEQNE